MELKTASNLAEVLSSGEAELYGLIEATALAKGIMSDLLDFGHAMNCTVSTDASAAIVMVHCVA